MAWKTRSLPIRLAALGVDRPQLAIIGIFFFLPAGQAVLQSFQVEDAFGMSREWVGLENFRQLWDNPDLPSSFQRTALFSVLVAGIGIVVSLALAIFADRIVRFAMVYKTLLDRALRRGASDCRRAVGVPVLALDRRGDLLPGQAGL